MENKTDNSSELNTTGKETLNTNKHKKKSRCDKCITLTAIINGTISCIALLALFIKINKSTDDFDGKNVTNNMVFDWQKPSGSLYAKYKKAAVASDNGLCSEIGRDILLKGGNAVDSAVATLICIGVVNPQSSGIGGGLIMTIYMKKLKKCITLDAREAAPKKAFEKMFVNNPSESLSGWKSIAVPGEFHGLWTAFKKFGSGKVNWRTLLEPSISLARRGFPVSLHLADSLQKKKKYIMENEDMKKMLINKKTGELYVEGEIMKRPLLADTLKSLAEAKNPVDLFYNGRIAKIISEEFKENNGYVSKDDLGKYKTIIYKRPIEIDGFMDDLTICGPPPPASFVITQAIIMIMSKFYNSFNPVNLNDPLVYHRLIEIEKFAYSQRTKLGDLKYVKSVKRLIKTLTDRKYYRSIAKKIKNISQPVEYYSSLNTSQVSDHGTSHVTVLDEDGNGVSCTSTTNHYFGSVRASSKLGIIWNNQMDDFSTPGVTNDFGYVPSPSNFIKPGKRPMSSMSPTIIYHKKSGDIKMVVGASGGSFIISATAQVIIRNMLFNQTVKEAVDAPRFHNQYLPYLTAYEYSSPNKLIEILEKKFKQNMSGLEKQASVVQVLKREDDGYIYGNSDFRRKIATYPTGY